LTSFRYPYLKRGNYGALTESDVALFERLLPGAERVITDPLELVGPNTDWIKNCRGYSQVTKTFIVLGGEGLMRKLCDIYINRALQVIKGSEMFWKNAF
jgi:hypothetical protein